jgi:hypothetical protein
MRLLGCKTLTNKNKVSRINYMTKLATKTSIKVKSTKTDSTNSSNSGFKPYQIRINITRDLYNEIQKAKATEYKFLDDAEIIKIFLSRGSSKKTEQYDDSDIDIADLTRHNLMMFAKGEDLANEPMLYNPNAVKPINWNN